MQGHMMSLCQLQQSAHGCRATSSTNSWAHNGPMQLATHQWACNGQPLQWSECLWLLLRLLTAACMLLQDRLNNTTMAGPHDMSSNDLLCSILWHVTCMVRHRSDCETGTFYLPLDLRQMHAPDAYFGNAQCVQTVTGKHQWNLYVCVCVHACRHACLATLLC